MEEQKKRWIGIVGTIVFHGILIAILIFCGFATPVPQDEEGILVMVGDQLESWGDLVPVHPMPEPAQLPAEPTPEAPAPKPDVSPEVGEELITSDQESVALNDAKKEAEEARKKKQQEELTKKQKEEQDRIRREQERVEAERREQERLAEEKRQREQAIKNKVMNAFQGATAQAGQAGTSDSGTGTQGSPTGNSTTGAASGSPGYGSYDLGGRGIMGSLPRPAFKVNDSGKVVVTITVDENGKVINALIGQGTETANTQLRQAAIEAAKRALFETKKGQATQTGTITYIFDSNN